MTDFYLLDALCQYGKVAMNGSEIIAVHIEDNEDSYFITKDELKFKCVSYAFPFLEITNTKEDEVKIDFIKKLIRASERRVISIDSRVKNGLLSFVLYGSRKEPSPDMWWSRHAHDEVVVNLNDEESIKQALEDLNLFMLYPKFSFGGFYSNTHDFFNDCITDHQPFLDETNKVLDIYLRTVNMILTEEEREFILEGIYPELSSWQEFKNVLEIKLKEHAPKGIRAKVVETLESSPSVILKSEKDNQYGVLVFTKKLPCCRVDIINYNNEQFAYVVDYNTGELLITKWG